MAPQSKKSIDALSHWIDDTMPERARRILLAAKIDVDQFQRHIGKFVGIYRSAQHVKNNLPQRSEEAAFAQELHALLGQAARLMDRSSMPPRVHALLLEVLHLRLSEDWNELQDRVLRDLAVVQVVLKTIDHRLRVHPARRGAKPKQARDALLMHMETEIERQLGPLKKSARITALEVLQVYGIAAPSPDRASAEKTVARITKRSPAKS